MKTLRKGDRGPEVRKLQEKLVAAGFRLKPDEFFWDATDGAVRAFQRKRGLLPDGIAGPKTLGASGIVDASSLGVFASRLLGDMYTAIGAMGLRAAMMAKMLAPSSQISRPAAELHISEKGIEFVYQHERLKSISVKLHWPGGASGVTLGPGYDMKERSAVTITSDMTSIGVDIATAQKIAKASGLQSTTKPTAQQFAKDNKGLVELTVDQERRLLRRIVPDYEKMVKYVVRVHLMQHEYDALVSFVYNTGPGRKFKTVIGSINQGKVAEAMKAMRSANRSGGNVMEALVSRRDEEVALYLYSDYGRTRAV